jgi:SPP1 family holin
MAMKISEGTWARTIVLALALINQLLTATGHSPINVADEDVNLLVSTIFTIVAAIVAWWKNNSFTKPAIEADEHMKSMRECEKAVDEQ